MRKAEFKIQAERTDNVFAIYRSQQYRWEDGQTADPQVYDIEYHLSEDKAIEAADNIDLELGFEAQVERVTFDYDDFNNGVDFREDFELADLDNYNKINNNCDTIYNGKVNMGNDLNPDAIVVMYRHHRYMNYSYAIEAIRFVRETNLKTEADLRDDSDSLRTTYCMIVSDLDELAEVFERGQYMPFNKINSGSRIVREFLTENGHPDYVEVEETEE